jgi:hypothetical protein
MKQYFENKKLIGVILSALLVAPVTWATMQLLQTPEPMHHSLYQHTSSLEKSSSTDQRRDAIAAMAHFIKQYPEIKPLIQGELLESLQRNGDTFSHPGSLINEISQEILERSKNHIPPHAAELTQLTLNPEKPIHLINTLKRTLAELEPQKAQLPHLYYATLLSLKKCYMEAINSKLPEETSSLEQNIASEKENNALKEVTKHDALKLDAKEFFKKFQTYLSDPANHNLLKEFQEEEANYSQFIQACYEKI